MRNGSCSHQCPAASAGSPQKAAAAANRKGIVARRIQLAIGQRDDCNPNSAVKIAVSLSAPRPHLSLETDSPETKIGASAVGWPTPWLRTARGLTVSNLVAAREWNVCAG